jgi:orotate phosphoribosyltransferase-like protein
MQRESLKNLHKKYRELQKQGIECGYSYDEIKMELMKAQQTSTYLSKSAKRNRRRKMRKQVMKERYNL